MGRNRGKNKENAEFKKPRPEFPQRAVITGGMPYGNKSLHFGHIGGVFVHADTFARFLKDRIGPENVIFVSGTDCYGSPIMASYKQYIDETQDECTIEAYVQKYHEIQKNILADYDIEPSLFATSAFGRSGEIHREVSEKVFNMLYEKKHLEKLSSLQFYDAAEETFLNGRQVVGKCPFEGCPSEKAYADECALGHQYMPSELIDPVSILSGEKPELREVYNWYFDLHLYTEKMLEKMDIDGKDRVTRKNIIKAIDEFLKKPMIHVTRKEYEKLLEQGIEIPKSTLIDEEKKPSVSYVFENLDDRDQGRAVLDKHTIRYRTGKTLVPFRLSGNADWGVPVPEKDELKDLTFWVWPESLWAPISFVKTYLEGQKHLEQDWKKWILDDSAKVFQFIGEDNIYFYGIAEMAMLMAYLDHEPTDERPLSTLNFPQIVSNSHLLFLESKASSSGAVKPPMADELLQYYTKDQLRMHFLSLGLSKKSVSFNPKPFDPSAKEEDYDVVLKDGNLLTNVFNRLVRSCFYTAQKYNDAKIPQVQVTEELFELVQKYSLEYESLMAKHEFHRVVYTLDSLIRELSKYWTKEMKKADDAESDLMKKQVLGDMFYAVKTTLLLLHPIAPERTEFTRLHLNLTEKLWSWQYIFEPVEAFMEDPSNHKLKEIPPQFDFFEKHPSQLENLE